MTPVRKVGVVAAGYVAAILVASAAVAVRIAITSGPDAQASSGMHAFGDSLLFVAVFGVSALVPTAAALVFLRPYRHFWLALSGLGLAVAATGVAAATLVAVGRHATAAPLAVWDIVSVLRILVAPLLALAFLVCALLSPYRFARLALVATTVSEVAVSAYAGYVWFFPLFFRH